MKPIAKSRLFWALLAIVGGYLTIIFRRHLPADLAAALSDEAGVAVEITIRGPRSFTWSFDGVNSAAEAILSNAAAATGAKVSTAHANLAEPGEPPAWMTSIYVDA